GEHGLLERVEWVRAAGADRLDELELSLNLVAVVPPEGPPPQVRGRVLGFFGVDVEEIARSGSSFVLHGDADALCEQVERLRERLGVSYVTVPDDSFETFAPVVAR